jgi:translation initiation factor IF-3
VPTDEARAAARERGLDLVEIAPDAHPPVCKILDYGKFRFETEKRAKEARKQQHHIEIKEVKFRPNIDDHDFETKLNHARRFLEQGKHVKVTVMFRRREMRRPDMGYRILERVVTELEEVASVESKPPDQLPGRDLSMVLKAG